MMMNLEQVAAKALARLLKKCHQKEAPCDRRFLPLFLIFNMVHVSSSVFELTYRSILPLSS